MPDKSRLLVIFDLDDTLIQTRKAFEPYETGFLERHGLIFTLQERNERFVGVTTEKLLRTLGDDFRRAHNGADMPEGFMDEMIAMYETAIDNRIEKIDGAADVLEWLRREGIVHCVASNSRSWSLPRKLANSGLDTYFNFHVRAGSARNAFCLDDVARGKPAPDLYFHAAREMGEFAPDACVVVEDSVPGIQAGREAGMYVIGFAGAYGRPEDNHVALLAAGAHVAAKDMTAVQEVITRRLLLPVPHAAPQ